MSTKVSRWPGVLKRAVKFLVKLVLHEDIDALRSNSVANQMRLNQVWAAGVRVLITCGSKGDRTPKDTPEWLDLYGALSDIKRIDAQKLTLPR